MTRRPFASRRELLAGAALLAVAPPRPGRAADGDDRPLVRAMKTPGCGCCEGWAEHLRASGFRCEVVEQPDLDARKAALGVPEALRACHTATLAGYVVEGHVPAAALRRLLLERPPIVGLAVPGMPAGSPGMPSPRPEPYAVLAFTKDGATAPFMRFVGEREEAA
jgi:hypothetical protein